MKILAVGGGSGGHVTPVVAVFSELKNSQPDNLELRFWCDRKFAPKARTIVGNFDSQLPVSAIFSGKFRRYHHLPWWRQLLYPSIVLPNIFDTVFIGLGFLQSVIKLLIWRPDVVFTKGGFVCLPVGLAAKMLRIPLVIHDSDAHPGLTNRVLSRWADLIGTGAPLKYYSYPSDRARYVGIPVSSDFKTFSSEQQRAAKQVLGVNSDQPLVVVTGGGLGAKRINDAVVDCLDELLKVCTVILVSGTGQYQQLRTQLANYPSDKFQLQAFVSKGMAQLLGAADAVVARAGGTTILELAALSKPTILIPNGNLTGGHQLKNAAIYEEARAAVVVREPAIEDNPAALAETIKQLLSDETMMEQIGRRFHEFSRPDAASDMAEMIISAVKTP